MAGAHDLDLLDGQMGSGIAEVAAQACRDGRFEEDTVVDPLVQAGEEGNGFGQTQQGRRRVKDRETLSHGSRVSTCYQAPPGRSGYGGEAARGPR